MADVVQMPGVVEQIKLVAGLRWQILRNGLRRKNSRWDLIGMVWVGVFSSLLVVGLSFAFYAGAYEFIAKGRAGWVALLYWAIFVWWQVFPMFVAGFGSNFEFATLLRFPLSLRAFYLLGLGYGLADFGAVSSIVWILSMLAGAASARAGVVEEERDGRVENTRAHIEEHVPVRQDGRRSICLVVLEAAYRGDRGAVEPATGCMVVERCRCRPVRRTWRRCEIARRACTDHERVSTGQHDLRPYFDRGSVDR